MVAGFVKESGGPCDRLPRVKPLALNFYVGDVRFESRRDTLF